MTPATWRSLVVASLAVAVLSGCAPSATNADDPQMDHTEASAELNELFAIAQDAVGGEWEVADGGAEPCGLPSGDRGVQYGFARYGAGVPLEKQQAVQSTVVSAWTAKDLAPQVGTQSIEETTYSTIRYPASGWGVDSLYLDFRLGEHGTAILGQTRCVPGDYAQINRDYHAEQSATPTPAQ